MAVRLDLFRNIVGVGWPSDDETDSTDATETEATEQDPYIITESVTGPWPSGPGTLTASGAGSVPDIVTFENSVINASGIIDPDLTWGIEAIAVYERTGSPFDDRVFYFSWNVSDPGAFVGATINVGAYGSFVFTPDSPGGSEMRIHGYGGDDFTGKYQPITVML